MDVQKRYLAVAVVCLFLFSSLAGCLDDNPEIDDEPERELQFEVIDLYPIDYQGEKHWVVEMVVTEVDFEGIDEVRWEHMEWAFNKNGSHSGGVGISEYEGPAPSDNGWGYVPIDPGSEIVTVGDRLIFYGISEWAMEADFRLLWAIEMTFDRPRVFEMVLGNVTVPDIGISMSVPVLDSIIFPGSTSYTYEAEVTDIDPANATLNWWTLQLRIESPTDEFGDFFGPLLEDPGVEGYEGEDSPPDIEFWYIDDPLGRTDGPGSPTAMDEGDSVKITGLSERFEGGIVSLFKGEDPIWTSDPIPEMPEPNMVLELGSPIIHHVNRNETAFWNVSIPISDIDPEDLISWDSVWVRVLDSEKDVKFYSELYGQDPGDYSDTIKARWNDDGPQDGVISIGDDIVIKGLDLTFQGGLVEVYRGLTLLDSTLLPSDWPVLDLWISTESPSFTHRMVETESYWDGSFNITHVNPENVVIPWDDIELRIVDRGTEEVLVPLTHPELFEYEHRTVPTIFYLEGGSPDGVDYKDLIVLSGLNLSFEGAWIEFYLDGELIGDEALPDVFNLTQIILIQLSSPSVSLYIINGSNDWHAVLNINKVTPKNAVAPWTDIQIRILNRTGAVLVPLSSVLPDRSVYDTNETDGFDIGLWYVEISQDGVTIGAGDAFKITGLSEAYKQGSVEIYHKGTVIGDATLPTDFP